MEKWAWGKNMEMAGFGKSCGTYNVSNLRQIKLTSMKKKKEISQIIDHCKISTIT